MNRQRGAGSVWLGLVAAMALMVALFIMAGSAAAQVGDVNNEAEECIGDNCNSGAVVEYEPYPGCIITVLGLPPVDPSQIDQILDAAGIVISDDLCNQAVVLTPEQISEEEVGEDPPQDVIVCPSTEQCSEEEVHSPEEDAAQDQYLDETGSQKPPEDLASGASAAQEQYSGESDSQEDELTEDAAQDQYTSNDPDEAAPQENSENDTAGDAVRSSGLLPASLPTTGASFLALLGAGLSAAGFFLKRRRG